MKALSTCILAIGILNGALVIAQEKPATLRDSIIQAVKLNPQTVSTDEFLESVNYVTKASKADLLPSAQISCSNDLSGSSLTFNSDPSVRAREVSRSCGISASVTLYDGGEGRARYKAAQASEQAIKNSYNTTDSLIPNTRGGIANNTLEAYVDLVMIRDNLKFSTDVLEVLNQFKKFSQDALLESAILDQETQIKELTDRERTIIERYKFYVTLDPSDNLADMDATIGSISIPASAEIAIGLALESGPEVLRRNSEVEMATWNLKALRAGRGPRVSLSGGVSKGSFENQIGSQNKSNFDDRRIGISASIPFSFGSGYNVKSAQSNLNSKKLERESAIRTAKYSISTTYVQLENAKNSYVILNNNYNTQVALITTMTEKIASGHTGDLDIDKMLSAVDTLENRYHQLTNKQTMIVYNLFSIQQVTGLLFTEFAPQTFN